jgi:hypothetical protein
MRQACTREADALDGGHLLQRRDNFDVGQTDTTVYSRAPWRFLKSNSSATEGI